MVVAFDYSMSCPAMCIAGVPGLSNTSFYYLTDTKKNEGVFFGGLVTGTKHQEWTTSEQRFHQISDHFIAVLNANKIPANTRVFIEDYSMGSKGKVYHIAENTGLMKYKLWRRGHDITPIAPTVIKKFATGKGNAKKPDMYNAFVQQTSVELKVLSKPDSSPCSDIVDAYWIAQLGLNQISKP